jgi:Flp pilus assembly pilin Flp
MTATFEARTAPQPSALIALAPAPRRTASGLGRGRRARDNARCARYALVGYAGTTTGGVIMKLPRRQFLHLAAGAAILPVISAIVITLTGHGAWSQTTRTIKIVVPVAPGGPTDLLPRLLAEQIGRTQGPTMVIENRPGAGTMIGTETVARTAPDGSTLLTTSPPFVINSHLRKLNYDPLTNFEPICYLASTPSLIVVNNTSPYRTLADLLNASMRKFILRFVKDESGATAIEYGLIAAGIAVAIIAVVQGLGTNLNTTFGTVQTSIK